MFEAPTNQIRWLFLDLNSYFASVEQQEHPELRGRPIAVVPSMTDATCAIAASYEAKAFGIKTGTKIHEAKKMCPDLVCVLARHNKYVEYHHRILEEVIKYTPINKVWSVDELSSKLPPNKQTPEKAIEVSHKIKQGLANNVGVAIKCSIGLAPNGFLAKVATDMQKPDGLVVLKKDNMPGKLFDLSLRDLPGINVNMEERLRKGGITSIEALWNISPKHARKVWGSVSGERFWYNLHGFEVPETKTNSSMLGHSRVLDPAHRPPHIARLIARRLTTKAAARLRRQEFHARHFVLGVRTTDGQKWAKQLSFPSSQDNFTFLEKLDQLWSLMITELRPQTLLKVSTTLHGLESVGNRTPDLFEDCLDENKKKKTQNTRLTALMDELNKRYGAETINLGISPETKSGHVGTKIAFSRIPDTAEFHE